MFDHKGDPGNQKVLSEGECSPWNCTTCGASTVSGDSLERTTFVWPSQGLYDSDPQPNFTFTLGLYGKGKIQEIGREKNEADNAVALSSCFCPFQGKLNSLIRNC